MATILVVDDELGIRALLSEILADEHGARVRIANLGGADSGSDDNAAARGAQVSLSFSKIAVSDASADAATTAEERAH